MNEKQMDRLDAEAREQRAASELAPCEPQAQSARCSVATGSLWVSAGLLEQLCRAWEIGAKKRRDAAARHGADPMAHSITDALYDQAQTLDDCVMELRLLAEDAGVRQPTENAHPRPHPGGTGQGAGPPDRSHLVMSPLLKSIGIAAKLVEVRDTYRDLLGNEKYAAKIDELRPVFALVMSEHKCNELEVLKHVQRQREMDGGPLLTDWQIAQFISAAVELLLARAPIRENASPTAPS